MAADRTAAAPEAAATQPTTDEPGGRCAGHHQSALRSGWHVKQAPSEQRGELHKTLLDAEGTTTAHPQRQEQRHSSRTMWAWQRAPWRVRLIQPVPSRLRPPFRPQVSRDRKGEEGGGRRADRRGGATTNTA